MTETGAGRESFGEFVAGALPGLLRFGHVLTGDPWEAEDLVQEALARSLRRWRSVRSSDAGPYVRRAMVNAHITRWRRWEARVRLGAPPDGSTDDPELRRSDDRDSLRRALVRLPARQRTVLVLRYYEDLPDARIAELMDCTPGTVRSQAARGLAALRPLLKPDGADQPDSLRQPDSVRRPAAVGQPGTVLRPEADCPPGTVRRQDAGEPLGTVRRPDAGEPLGTVRRTDAAEPLGTVRRTDAPGPLGTVRLPDADRPPGTDPRPDAAGTSGAGRRPETIGPSDTVRRGSGP